MNHSAQKSSQYAVEPIKEKFPYQAAYATPSHISLSKDCKKMLEKEGEHIIAFDVVNNQQQYPAIASIRAQIWYFRYDEATGSMIWSCKDADLDTTCFGRLPIGEDVAFEISLYIADGCCMSYEEFYKLMPASL